MTKVTWSAKDFFGAVVARGELVVRASAHIPQTDGRKAALQSNTELQLKLDQKGYFTLSVTAWDGDKELDTAETTFAILDDFDFGSVQGSPFRHLRPLRPMVQSRNHPLIARGRHQGGPG